MASAVQVMCYEVYSTLIGEHIIQAPKAEDRPATSNEFEGFFDHLLQTLDKTDFLDLNKTKRFSLALKRVSIGGTMISVSSN